MPEVTVDPVQAVPQRIEGRCVQGQVLDAEGLLVGLHGRVSQLRGDLEEQQQVPPAGRRSSLGFSHGATPSRCSTLRTVLGEHSKSTAIRRRLAPPSRILRIACTWWGLNFRGGPRTFLRLSHRDPGVTVERHPAAPLAGMGKSIPSCRVEINRVFQPPAELRQGGISSQGRKQGCFQPGPPAGAGLMVQKRHVGEVHRRGNRAGA